MDSKDYKSIFEKMKFGVDAFHKLMQWRVRRVLMVLPHYDAWILEHDAKLSEQIVGEYHQLNLTTVPRFSIADNAKDALNQISHKSFDMVLTGERLGELTPLEFATEARIIDPDLQVLLFYSSRGDLVVSREDISTDEIDAEFVWTGDPGLFLAMIKYVEDKHNAPNDTADGRVGVLLMVEDSTSFYSACLPPLYGEIMTQTQRLIAEEMNDTDKYLRMRTRPKVLLARNWEEALNLGETYRHALIGIVSDIDFPCNGQLLTGAGFDLVNHFRSIGITVPVLFQSSDESHASKAREMDARFQSKQVNDLQQGIRRFILQELGFGDFVFRNPDGREITRVTTLNEFEKATASIPVESMLYHASRNDFSRWLIAHGEYQIAKGVRRISNKDFPSPNEHRQFLCRALQEVRESRLKGRLVEFSFDSSAVLANVIRYGSGSLGGKGRGLAFFNELLHSASFSSQYSPITVGIPHTLIVATGEFDKFIKTVQIDNNPRRSFLKAPLTEELTKVLESFLACEPGPLAVRSSSLLEDSRFIPLAGVYETLMIPAVSSKDERLRLVCNAVKLVWSCVFSSDAVKYRASIGMAGEEEKMAVVIQRIAGREHGQYWFPRLSGTAQSLNYYPIGFMAREDGIARLAVGLGKSIVGGEYGFPFCPKYPTVPWRAQEESIREKQTHLWVLRSNPHTLSDANLLTGEDSTLEKLTMDDAEKMNVLRHMVSTWDTENCRMADGLESPGVRVADFRDILVYDWLPLAPLVDTLLNLAQTAMGMPVELEYSLDWEGDVPKDVSFSLLQVRPLVDRFGNSDELTECPEDSRLLFRSEKALGHGIINNIRDVVWVDSKLYNPVQTENLRDQISTIMDTLAEENRYAVLIGPGRWGTRDRFLGIPVTWAQVRQARLVVEVTRESGDPDPSQGSHFFHNLVSLGAGYAHVAADTGFIDWDTLNAAASGNGAVRHSKFPKPLNVVIDGRHGKAWIEREF